MRPWTVRRRENEPGFSIPDRMDVTALRYAKDRVEDAIKVMVKAKLDSAKLDSTQKDAAE